MTYCRLCARPYQPDPFGDAADRRCPTCREQRRYWTPDQLGTRAHVFIRIRWWEINPDTGQRERKASDLDGLTGIGTRVSTPEDGWQVRLLESPERSLYFGGGSVVVDWELLGQVEPERSVFAVAAGNGRGLASAETGGTANPCDSSHGKAPDWQKRMLSSGSASQGATNAKSDRPI